MKKISKLFKSFKSTKLISKKNLAGVVASFLAAYAVLLTGGSKSYNLLEWTATEWRDYLLFFINFSALLIIQPFFVKVVNSTRFKKLLYFCLLMISCAVYAIIQFSLNEANWTVYWTTIGYISVACLYGGFESQENAKKTNSNKETERKLKEAEASKAEKDGEISKLKKENHQLLSKLGKKQNGKCKKKK